MKFDKVIMNPPYDIGGKIWDEVRKISESIVCLMPLAQYKKENRYKYIDSFEIINSSLFDVRVTTNLCITTYNKISNNKEYEDFLLESFNQNYRSFYEYNKKNAKGYFLKEKRNKPYTDFDVDLDFIETNRSCVSPQLVGGGNSGFSKNGCGYKFNVLKKDYIDNWLSGVATIHFNHPIEKDNFSKWWYSSPKEEGLSSKVLVGVNLVTVSRVTSFAIPQIDWEKISDHPLWKEGKYDEAVLDTMGLRWEDNSKTKLIKKD